MKRRYLNILHLLLLPLHCSRAVMREFCRISLEFIRKGSNPRMYQAAAREREREWYVMVNTWLYDITEKLGVAPDTVRHGVEGLMYLFTECSKLMV